MTTGQRRPLAHAVTSNTDSRGSSVAHLDIAGAGGVLLVHGLGGLRLVRVLGIARLGGVRGLFQDGAYSVSHHWLVHITKRIMMEFSNCCRMWLSRLAQSSHERSKLGDDSPRKGVYTLRAWQLFPPPYHTRIRILKHLTCPA
jgi:hypothetical protein